MTTEKDADILTNREKIWKKIDGQNRESTRYIRCVVVNIDGKKYLIDGEDARIRPFDVNTAIQLIIAKPQDYSFPSGHTAASVTSVVALYLAGEKRLWKIALILTCFIAFSRMYLYVHYPTDVLGGAVVGVISGYIGYKVTLRMSRHSGIN